MLRGLALLVAAVLVASSCAGGGPDLSAIGLAAAQVPRASADPADASAAGGAVNAFGLDLYRRVGASGGNVVVSPASIAIALAMARAGARGETAAEMDAVLHAVASDDHAGWLNALDQALSSRSGTFIDDEGKQLPVTLRIANAPFAQRGMSLVPAYLEALAARFGAGLRLVDYQQDPEAARHLINAWVDRQTEQRIPELIPAGLVDRLTRLVLVNAIYLKAPWLKPFDATRTSQGTFTRADGSPVEVPMMTRLDTFAYSAGDGWQAVQLPYIGGKLAMTLILPDDLASFEAGLTAAGLARITDALASRPVNLTLPRFGIETQLELAPVLAALGMPSAFDPARADFSGITTQEALFISNVIHQANIDVDEKGTEAAAATAVVMRGTAEPGEPVTMRLDRPFLFALRDLPSGTILFLGRVADPAAKA